MRVLLISPLRNIDPACGDVIYTEMLVKHPPEGVVYETYADALKRGALVEHGKRGRFGKEPILTVMAKGINILRGWRWLFWEPFRYFSVKEGEFDAIHLHVFSARFLNLPCPLLVSNAAPLRYLYTGARGHSRGRVRVMEWADRMLAWMMGVNHTSYRAPQASRVIAFTRYLREWYVSRGIVEAERVDVVPIFAEGGESEPAPRKPRRVGFVAKDFLAKGGDTMLAAFAKVRERMPEAELVIVGCEPRMAEEELTSRGIRWEKYVVREALLGEVMPSFDVFAYPTRCDGQPLVVLEAMAAGVPVITSDYQAMPEMVDEGRVGLVVKVGDAAGLAQGILRLMDAGVNEAYRRKSREWFKRTYSAEAVREALRRSYMNSIEAWHGNGGMTAVEAAAEVAGSV